MLTISWWEAALVSTICIASNQLADLEDQLMAQEYLIRLIAVLREAISGIEDIKLEYKFSR